ncbi:uracil-DNA glycosylase family protein [Lentibacillus cibarius]|uniref:Uracil-DNA glycosylase-like domain-containing protein n=1 Tax=Lentibacillus cibarius TaxID=2583219 RepID=A0A5S3QJ55_9BACI|nr:uracil-DNA glycosylase family protein [Lentibacillus cibarius]TMN21895.1 hypothetical protein FFL34_07035 [Lentibacillus cibarius]
MSYNKHLYHLYQQHWDDLRNSIKALPKSKRPTHPLLLKLTDEVAYQEADIKIMFVGKETNDWEGTFGHYHVKGLQDFYETFWNKDTKAKKTLFWKFMRKWISQIEEELPNASVSVTWNNIYKIGRSGKRGKPNKATQEITKRDFCVFKEELRILKPDVVIFLTGPGYDTVLETYLPGVEFREVEAFNKRNIAHCSHPSLSRIAIRTYHPQYLNTLKPEEREFHRKTPIEVILKQLKFRGPYNQ